MTINERVLNINVSVDSAKEVRITLDSAQEWFAFPPEQALDFARAISEKAVDAMMRRSRMEH
jgi:hypothetical protein